VNVYDGDHIIAEYEDDTLVRKFIYDPAIDEPVIENTKQVAWKFIF